MPRFKNGEYVSDVPPSNLQARNGRQPIRRRSSAPGGNLRSLVRQGPQSQQQQLLMQQMLQQQMLQRSMQERGMGGSPESYGILLQRQRQQQQAQQFQQPGAVGQQPGYPPGLQNPGQPGGYPQLGPIGPGANRFARFARRGLGLAQLPDQFDPNQPTGVQQLPFQFDANRRQGVQQQAIQQLQQFRPPI